MSDDHYRYLDGEERDLTYALHQLLVKHIKRMPDGNLGLATALSALTHVTVLLIASFPPEHRRTVFDMSFGDNGLWPQVESLAADIQQTGTPARGCPSVDSICNGPPETGRHCDGGRDAKYRHP